MSFAENLKYLMTEKKITQQQLAENIGYSQRAVSKWINNQSEPSATAILKCAIYLNTTPNELLSFEEGIARDTKTDIILNSEELKLISDYRELTPELQLMLTETIKTWKQTTERTIKKKNA